MKAVLSRRYGKNQTFGRLMVLEGEKVNTQVLSLELPWNGNQKSSSCIPEGKYEVHRIYSPKFGKCFHVLDVPDRTAILIHSGNYASLTEITDTTGCILPGMAFEDINFELSNLHSVIQATTTPPIANSKKAMLIQSFKFSFIIYVVQIRQAIYPKAYSMRVCSELYPYYHLS